MANNYLNNFLNRKKFNLESFYNSSYKQDSCKQTLIHPYLKTYMKVLHMQPENIHSVQNSKQLSVAKMYDIWLIGLVILQLILKPDTYTQLTGNCPIISSDINGITDSDLIDESLALYLNILKKYVLCPIDKRRNLKFVQEMIMLGEKHD
jgi:hypothetical protein